MLLRYLTHALKYAALTLIGAMLVIGGAALFRGTNGSPLTGRLLTSQERGITPVIHYDVERTQQGVSIPKDTHVIFDIPAGLEISRVTFFGGPDFDDSPYWGYCYTGNEQGRKAEGYKGMQIYDGLFFYSKGELKRDTPTEQEREDDLLDVLHRASEGEKPETARRISLAEMFKGPKTCYVMASIELFAGPDSDDDWINDPRERSLGTDPNNPDTDGDGIWDGVEVFIGKYNPLSADTDEDGLPDGLEDKNRNGRQDAGETSARNPDTDRDGLCDGDGTGPRCPERPEIFCESVGQCRMRPRSPVFGEDMNLNGIVDEGETDPTTATTFKDASGQAIHDWTYKFEQLHKP